MLFYNIWLGKGGISVIIPTGNFGKGVKILGE